MTRKAIVLFLFVLIVGVSLAADKLPEETLQNYKQRLNTLTGQTQQQLADLELLITETSDRAEIERLSRQLMIIKHEAEIARLEILLEQAELEQDHERVEQIRSLMTHLKELHNKQQPKHSSETVKSPLPSEKSPSKTN